jgi:hypothetical protein
MNTACSLEIYVPAHQTTQCRIPAKIIYLRKVSEYWIGNCMRWCGHGLSPFPVICQEGLMKTMKPSLTLAGYRAEIWIWTFPEYEAKHFTVTLVGSGVACADVVRVFYDLLGLQTRYFAGTLCLQLAPNWAVTDLFCQRNLHNYTWQ